MPSPSDLETRARAFINEYAALFASPDASDPARVGDLAQRIGKCYRPGMTVFTKGKIERFESQEEAASLIEKEMRNNIATSLGTCLILEALEKIDVSSVTSALCWLRWRFEPAAGSGFEGKGWRFVNVYGFRAGEGEDGEGDGWEIVVRDQEVDGVMRVTGRTFE